MTANCNVTLLLFRQIVFIKLLRTIPKMKSTSILIGVPSMREVQQSIRVFLSYNFYRISCVVYLDLSNKRIIYSLKYIYIYF